MKIDFRYKKTEKDSPNSCDNIIHGQATMTIIAHQQAEYPGGFSHFSKYLHRNVFDKISDESSLIKIQGAVVKFIINEEGQVIEAQISMTSTDENLDTLLLDAINKMPVWKPATNSTGEKVRQEFRIPLGNDGC